MDSSEGDRTQQLVRPCSLQSVLAMSEEGARLWESPEVVHTWGRIHVETGEVTVPQLMVL